MKSKFFQIDEELEQIKKNNLYRKMRFGFSEGSKIIINDKKLINLCSNDYLGIPPTKIKLKQIQSSSRLVSGNDLSFEILEKKLARHKSKQSGLVFPTGYMANLGVISAMAKKGDLILSDDLNHASIIEACKLSGAIISVYRHNDVEDLAKKAQQKGKNKFVITEGIFSMDGDFAKLKEITEISQKNNLVTILDDAHGDFVVGRDGRGSANHFGVSKKIDVYISSLSKGLGSFGGYVASQNNVIDYCINKSKSFIYTSALPSSIVEDSLARFETNREKYRKKLQNNVFYILKNLKKIGYKITSQTHIVPIIIGDERITLRFAKFLFNNGIFAQPIRYPTVSKGGARIRVSITGWLSKNEIEKSLQIFDAAYTKFLK